MLSVLLCLCYTVTGLITAIKMCEINIEHKVVVNRTNLSVFYTMSALWPLGLLCLPIYIHQIGKTIKTYDTRDGSK